MAMTMIGVQTVPISPWSFIIRKIEGMAGVKDENLYRPVKIHFIRDLSGWASKGERNESEPRNCFRSFVIHIFPESDEIFLIAANDGQLIESLAQIDSKQTDVKRPGNYLRTCSSKIARNSSAFGLSFSI